jgi:hypothetical protein
MVDRPARTQILNAITAYLHGEIHAFEFDERLHQGVLKTKDRTVAFARTALWQLYDDITDHPVHLSKEAWDFVQRLRLILASNVEVQTSRSWTLRQPLALVGLLILLLTALRLGLTWNFWCIDILVGLITILPLYLPSTFASQQNQEQRRLVPFESLPQLRAIRRTVTDFQKEQYPSALVGRRLRSPAWTVVMLSISTVAWAVCAPLFLTLGLLPTPQKIKILSDQSPSPAPAES